MTDVPRSLASASVTEAMTYRVLVIDDNPAIHADFKKILTSGDIGGGLAVEEALLLGEALPASVHPRFELDCALQGQEGVDAVCRALAEQRPYAMAFIDMRMPPGWDGLETVEHLWAVDSDVQVVICTAYSEYDWSELLAKVGHSDKLLVLKKPFEPVEVLQNASALSRKWRNERALRQHVEALEQVVSARTEGLEAANRQLRYLATHDALTGLSNRVILDDRFEQAVAHAAREGHEFAILLLDLDRFKLINDSLGHRAGDELLKEVAKRLKGLVRSIDTLVRLGGDEFIVLVSKAGEPDMVEKLAARMVEILKPPVRLLGVDVYTSASIGIAFYPNDGASIELLIAHADAAMYAVKQNGRDGFQCFATGMSAITREQIRLESDLHSALASGQLELHYQPKVDAVSGAIHGAEALIRWRHPERGLLLPETFIPLAESCGLLASIGEWVVREACRQAKAWQQEGHRPLRVAVNLSPSQFRLEGLVDTIRCALEAAALEARFLEVELTETSIMSNPEESISILESLSRMGVLVSVDDFGTGYSNMSYLRRFPIDKLKIDRSFIDEITRRAEDASIVRAMVSLAHSLNLRVVAEGVETREQLELLRALGCDQYQGYYCSAALPPGEFDRLLRDSPTRSGPQAEVDAVMTQSRLARLR